jgi:hypothetical protein
MARTPIIAETHSARTLTGSAVLSRIALTGWGAMSSGTPALETFTDRGRLWWKFTASSNLLELFRRSTMTAADRVAYTTSAVADGKATLVQDGTTLSGFSGSCDIDEGTAGSNPDADATGDLIVSYAHESDLLDAYAGVGGYLDENSKYYAQGTRFEALLKTAQNELNELLVPKLLNDIEQHLSAADQAAITALLGGLSRDAKGRRLLAVIADPRQLAPVHALLCAYRLEAHRTGKDRDRADMAQWHYDRASRLLGGMSVALDLDADGDVDVERGGADRTLGRA